MCLALTSTVACSDDFDPGSLVNKLRILAVQADTPFAEPGQSVTLTALAVDPEQRQLTWAWGLCDASQTTLAVECLRQTQLTELHIGTDTQHTFVMPASGASYVGVVVIACPGRLQADTTTTLPVSCIDPGGHKLTLSEFEVGLKRVFVREPDQNQNPRIEAVSIEGRAWDGLPAARCKKTEANACTKFAEQEIVVSAPGASEQSVDSAGKPIREQAVVQFYADGGDFDDDVRLADDARTKWHANAEDAGKRITFWFVVRDDRGGVSWTSRELQVP